MWVPLHVGIMGNGRADKVVNIVNRTILHPKITDILINDIKDSIEQKVNTIWKYYWNSNTLSYKSIII